MVKELFEILAILVQFAEQLLLSPLGQDFPLPLELLLGRSGGVFVPAFVLAVLQGSRRPFRVRKMQNLALQLLRVLQSAIRNSQIAASH